MGFLDRRPFNAADPDGRALLAALLAAYDQGPAVREFVLAAGLRPADFSCAAPMSQVWPEVLRKAAEHGRLRDLIEAVAQHPDSTAHDVIARLAGEPAAGISGPELHRNERVTHTIPLPGGHETQEWLGAAVPDPGIGGPVASADGGPLLIPQAGLVMGSYRAEVAEIAPEQLFDRGQELAELADFCAGDQSYAWWAGNRWAGKSALLAWFSLHPPEGIQVVSFFVTGRRVDRSDSSAFVNGLIEQLTILAGEPYLVWPGNRHGHAMRLLEAVSASLEAAGQRLLLVVDGLDEDAGGAAAGGQASIASLLPRRPLQECACSYRARYRLMFPTMCPAVIRCGPLSAAN